MHYLIDGYNLAHAMGLMPERLDPEGLERVRTALLGRVAGLLGATASQATVVFDACQSPPHLPAAASYRGIQVCFASADSDADTFIAHWLVQSKKKDVAVVSDDRAVQASAQQHGGKPLSCADFLKRREKPVRGRSATSAEEERRGSRRDRAYWLSVFGDSDRAAKKEQ